MVKEHFLDYVRDGALGALRDAIDNLYQREPNNPSYLFSTGGGIRGAPESRRHTALSNLEAWSAVATTIARQLLLKPEPDMFFHAFAVHIAPQIPQFGLGYWAKFTWDDLYYIAPACVDLGMYSVIGVGCVATLEAWQVRITGQRNDYHAQLAWSE